MYEDIFCASFLSRCGKGFTTKIQIEEDKAKIIARLSGGSILKAMQFIDDDALALRQKALSCLQDNFSIKDIWSFIDELSSFERNKINDIMSHLQMLLRDLLLMKVNKDSDIIYNQDIKDDLLNIQNKYDEVNLLTKLTFSRRDFKTVKF